MVNTKVAEVSDYILEQIRSNKLKSGDRIPTESELCDNTGTSRTSVREAIKRLQALTILQVKQGDGTYISSPDEISFSEPLMYKMFLGDITWNEIFQFREMMEFSVVQNAIRTATPDDIKNLKTMNEFFNITQNEVDPNHKLDYQIYKKKDLDFHKELARLSGNRLLNSIYEFSLELISSSMLENFQYGHSLQTTYKCHNLVIRAIEKRDVFFASYAVSNCIDDWAKQILTRQSKTFAMPLQTNPSSFVADK